MSTNKGKSTIVTGQNSKKPTTDSNLGPLKKSSDETLGGFISAAAPEPKKPPIVPPKPKGSQ